MFSVYFTDSDDARDIHQEIYYETGDLALVVAGGVVAFGTPPAVSVAAA